MNGVVGRSFKDNPRHGYVDLGHTHLAQKEVLAETFTWCINPVYIISPQPKLK